MIQLHLTPLLKTLEKKEFISRERSKEDERVLVVSITEKGMKLREKAVKVPGKMAGCIQIDEEEASQLYSLIHKLLSQFD